MHEWLKAKRITEMLHSGYTVNDKEIFPMYVEALFLTVVHFAHHHICLCCCFRKVTGAMYEMAGCWYK